MSKSTTLWFHAAAAVGALAMTASAAQAQDKEIVFGLHCDRTGATQASSACSFCRAIRTTSRC